MVSLYKMQVHFENGVLIHTGKIIFQDLYDVRTTEGGLMLGDWHKTRFF